MWKGVGGQRCSRSPHHDWDYCREHVSEAITLSKVAHAEVAKHPGAMTKGAKWVGKQLIKAAVGAALAGGASYVLEPSSTSGDPPAAIERGKKKAGKKKAGKKKAAK